jgi:hypothetical protein
MFASLEDYTQTEAKLLDLRVKELEELCSELYLFILSNNVAAMYCYLNTLDNAADGLPLDYEEEE